MVGADLAMYAAKHGGRDRHAPFSARTLEEAEAMLLAAPVARLPTPPVLTFPGTSDRDRAGRGDGIPADAVARPKRGEGEPAWR